MENGLEDYVVTPLAAYTPDELKFYGILLGILEEHGLEQGQEKLQELLGENSPLLDFGTFMLKALSDNPKSDEQ